MGRLLLAGALLALALGPAYAGPTRKVLVESEPPGASVYVDDVDKGVACEPTPCEVVAPIGTVTLIIRKDGYEPEVAELEVPKGKRTLQHKYALKSAVATIKVDSPKGASVRVDNEDKGKAPVEVATSAGEPHHVVVTLNGKTVADEVVEVATGDEYLVKTRAAGKPAVADAAPIIEDDDEDTTGGDGGGVGSAGITDKGIAKPRPAFVTAAVAFDVGFRNVSYTTPAMSDFARTLSRGTQALMGPAVEVWPGRMLGIQPLRGLSVFGRAQFSVVPQTVKGPDLDGDAQSKWSSYELSVRQRFGFSSFFVEASGGYAKDGFDFETASATDFDKMPVTDYQSLRLGAKAGYISDNVEPYISGENRIVFAAGELADRYASSSAGGMRGSAGVNMRFGMVTTRIEGTLMSYSWKLVPEQGGKWPATAASDSIKLISLAVGLSY